MNLEEFNKFINTEEKAKQALMGTILADGSIQKQRKSGQRNSKSNYAYLEINHTARNLDYLKFKQELLNKIFGIKTRISPHNKVTKNKTYFGYRLSTNTHEWLKQVRDIIYDDNRVKIFPKQIIDNLNDISLFLMYLDDGNLKCRYDETKQKFREVRTKFCLNSFTLKELQYFISWLKQTYDIDAKYYRDGIRKDSKLPQDRGYVVWLNTTNTKKLMEVFDKFYNLIPSMNYKFLKFHLL